MSQRISLTRVIAIHWYGFRQIFDVQDNVLISGAFGTGKSAILDLMQFVLLGEHWRANRAAAGSARGRDLVGYCLGDTNQAGRDGTRHFLRRSGVTLVALEFTRPAERGGREAKRETWGVRLEFSSPDARPRHTYFFIPARMEYAQIAPDGHLLEEDAFKTWIRREGFGDFLITERQGDYLREMATPRHLNFDDLAFHRTFPKAIAFELEENVERFIREFILEECPLDVREVRASLRAYDDTRRRLEKQEDEAAFLRRISEHHATCERSRREEGILRHTEHALALAKVTEDHLRKAEELARLESEHAQDLQQLEQARLESGQLTALLDEVRFQIGKDPEAVKISDLDRQKQELQSRVQALKEARSSARQQMDERHHRWTQWLKHGASLAVTGLKDDIGVDDLLLGRLRTGTDSERLSALPLLAQRFNDIWQKVQPRASELRAQIESREKRLQQLGEDLENLAGGRAPGSFPLFHALRQKLGSRVEQLGRLIEVRPEAERWWPALELFLGRNRWVLVVEDAADYRQALEILRRTPPGREPESLLHPGEIRAIRVGARDGSLFTKVDVSHPVARRYVEHLLGEVICVEDAEALELTEAGRAITPEGIYKQAPLRRRMKPASAVELTLGREGLGRMRTAKERERQEVLAEHASLKLKLEDVQTWLENGKKGGLSDFNLPDRSSELPDLPAREAELGRIWETLELLMTPERAGRQQRFRELSSQQSLLEQKVGRLLQSREQFSIRARPLRESVEGLAAEVQEARIGVEASRVRLSQRFEGLLDAELNARRDALREQFPRWQDCFSAVRETVDLAAKEAVEARQRRNAERVRLSTGRDARGNLMHPEYATEWPAEEEDNTRWASRLRDLDQIELEQSRRLAVDRKRDWERRLEENVLNELNRRIQEAEDTVRLLDRYLSQPVGRFRYRISQRKDTAGYGPIWSLLKSGLEPTDPLMASVRDGEVQRAMEELMRAVNATDGGPVDPLTLRILDYRNYHRYDLEMVPADKPDAPAISLGRSGRNLSGGESQAPFFISMLAAFRRVYDRGDRASARSQRLGLVVMDEAFSKLSGDGIEDCLELARSFQLQLVMAFPPERLGVMVPHAQTVVMCQKEVERDAEGYVTGITNIPLLTTMSEALDALS